MLIGLYNLEPKYINIALEKIRLYHLLQGDTIQDYFPLEHDRYHKIYCSSIFTWSGKSYVTNDMICGGTGFDLTTTLPPEIEAMKPKINIGFTTRGCIRRCPFCVVREKEGDIRAVAKIDDIWDGKSREVILLDNNILALWEWFFRVCDDLNRYNLKVDFNQGLDIRLLDNEVARTLATLKYTKQIRFSWDQMRTEDQVKRGIQTLLQYINPHRLMCFVLIGYDTTEEEDLYRVEYLKSLKIDPFAMSYNKDPRYRHFARWVNHKAICVSVPWKEYRIA